MGRLGLRTVIGIAVCALASRAAGALPQVDHAALARDLLARDGLTSEDREPTDYLAYIRERSLTASLGAFHVSISRAALEEKRAARDFRDACVSLVEVQERWLAWTGTDAELDPAQDDLETLRSWVSKWNLRTLRKASAEGHSLASALLGVNAEMGAVLERLGAKSGESGGNPVKVVLAPSRGEFVGLCSLAGLSRPSLRSHLWVKGIEKWTWFFVEDVRFVAFEYATQSASTGDYSRGNRIDSRNPTGLRQHISQLAVNEMLRIRYGDDVPAAFVSGIAMNLVIDLFGEVNTRIEGDLRGRMTQAREMFIPGGNPTGGVLPKISAESRWRVDQGKFHFVRVLRQVQKAGGKRKRGVDKVRTFLLQSDNGKLAYALRAPVLGPSAVATVTPPAWAEADRLEFIRAYKSAFLHWLREHGTDDDGDAQAAFARLLSALEEAGGEVSFEKTVEAIYGVPLSEAELGEACLEGRFLRWLSKQRG
ncbi:MAG: hypothetical protein CMJ84_13725 [Planctomycetes bacterium]|jgi:hypothetical protein|nr:hypothetical protein [Planctomycetota bacterium]MDP6409928.1 hypothetical protein [Planctomycetota bacterium]